MRVLVVEDEAVVARRLIRLVRSILGDHLHGIDHAASLGDAVEAIAERPIDLLFLDLSLEGRDGFRVLEEAASGAFHTIIVSAHADQAIRAFEHGVVDFVPKPFDERRLRRAIERATGRQRAAGEHLRHLAVRRQGSIELVPLDSVLWIAGAGDYSEIHCADGRRHLHDKTLSCLEVLLPNRFERVHRSYIVDWSRVERLRTEPGSRYRLELDTGDEIPVSRTRAAEIRDRLL